MKLKLIALSTAFAANCYAANIIINVPVSNLSGYTVIKAEISDSNNTNPVSAVRNCSRATICSITINSSLTPGLHPIKIYASNSNKLIGEVVVDKFANHSGDDVFNIEIKPTPAFAHSPTSSMPNSVDTKDLVVRTNGFFKMTTVFFPGFKTFSDFTGGWMDLMVGKGASGGSSEIQAIANAMIQINNRVTAIQNQLTDFHTAYNKDQYALIEREISDKLDKIKGPANDLQTNLNNTGSSIDQYLDKYQKTPSDTIPLVVGWFNTGRSIIHENIQSLTRDNGRIFNDFNEKLDNLLAEQSRADKRVNYIALYNYYNAQYTYCFSKVLTTLMMAQQMDKLAAVLISSDSKYREAYIGKVSLIITNMSTDKTIAQNQEIIKKYYDNLYKIALDAFPVSRYKNVYGKVGLKLENPQSYTTDGMLDYGDLSSKSSIAIQSFDGFSLSGIYGGLTASTSWQPTGFVLAHDDFKNSTFYVYRDKSVSAYNPNVLSRHLGAGELYFIPTSFQRPNYTGGVDLFLAHDESMYKGSLGQRQQEIRRIIERKRRDDFNKSSEFKDVRVLSEYPVQGLKSVMIIGDKSKYEGNDALEVSTISSNNQIRFPRPKFASIDGGVSVVPQLTGIYSFKFNSPKDGKTKLYLFGVNYSAWSDNYTHAYEGTVSDNVRYRNKFGWGATVFCPTLSCQQQNPGTIVFPDRVTISMQNKDGQQRIVIEPTKYNAYIVTTRFPDEYAYSFYEPKVSKISSGEHLLSTTSSTVVSNSEQINEFTYQYVMKGVNKTDHPTFVLKLKHNECVTYDTSLGKRLKTCVVDKGNNAFEIDTKNP